MSIFLAQITWGDNLRSQPEGYRQIEPLLKASPSEHLRIELAPGALLACSLTVTDEWRRRDRQPFVDRDKMVAILADCRLDNRKELYKELAVETTRRDAELLLRAYEQWGPGMAEHLVGDFALVVWDWRRGRVLAVRDHLGAKPLYCAFGHRNIAFASDVEILVQFLKSRPQPDDQLVVEHLLMRYRSVDRTFWNDVKRIPGGHLLLATESHCDVRAYWDPPTDEVGTQDIGETQTELRRLFFRSVERRLETDRPLIAHLSGGIDSSSIVCVADRIYAAGPAREPMKLVSALYPDIECDETPFISAVRRETRFEWEGWEAHDEGFPDLSSPSLGGPGMGVYFSSDLEIGVRAGARVVLSGQGGDQLGGCSGVGEDRVGQDLFRFLIRSVVGRGIPGGIRLARLRYLARLATPIRVRRSLGRIRGRFIAPNWLERRWTDLAGELVASGYPSPSALPTTQVRSLHWAELTSPALGLTIDIEQRRAAKFGLEMRFPFLDKELVEFVLSVPFHHWPAPTPYARLQRDFLADLLPTEVRERTEKTVFSPAVARRVKSGLPDLRRLFFKGEWTSARYVNRTRAQALLARAEASQDGSDFSLWRGVWGIATLEAWLRAVSGYATQG